LAEIAKDAPIELNLSELNCVRQTALRSWNLYRELGFSSLLKDLGAEVGGVRPPSGEF